MTGSFVMVPGWLLEAKLSGTDYLVYMHIASFGLYDPSKGSYVNARPSAATIADRSGVSVRTVRRSLATLVRLGAVRRYVRRNTDGSQGANLFVVQVGRLELPNLQTIDGVDAPEWAEGIRDEFPNDGWGDDMDDSPTSPGDVRSGDDTDGRPPLSPVTAEEEPLKKTDQQIAPAEAGAPRIGTSPAPAASHRASRSSARARAWPGRTARRARASAVPSACSSSAASR